MGMVVKKFYVLKTGNNWWENTLFTKAGSKIIIRWLGSIEYFQGLKQIWNKGKSRQITLKALSWHLHRGYRRYRSELINLFVGNLFKTSFRPFLTLQKNGRVKLISDPLQVTIRGLVALLGGGGGVATVQFFFFWGGGGICFLFKNLSNLDRVKKNWSLVPALNYGLIFSLHFCKARPLEGMKTIYIYRLFSHIDHVWR